MKLSEAITIYGDTELSEETWAMLKDKLHTGMVAHVLDKNKLKKIDMSVCIESGIDCEFSKYESFHGAEIRKLYRIEGMNHCRPRFSHIHASPTGWDKCPIPEGFVIRCWFSGEDRKPDLTDKYCSEVWKLIRMFEITGYASGYE